jgi:hypothetical protein
MDSSNINETPPVVEETPPVVEETPPPVVEETPPVVEETPPVVEETPPVVEETPPVVEETPPVVEETPPVVEETPPATIEETPPAVVDETPPVVEETPLVVEETPPTVEETPPVVEETPPVVEEIPPVVEETPPTVEETPPVVDENQLILNFYYEIKNKIKELLFYEEEIEQLSQPEIDELIKFSNEKTTFLYNTFIKPTELYENYYNNSLDTFRPLYSNAKSIDIQNLLLNNKILVIAIMYSDKQFEASSYTEMDDNGTINYVINQTMGKKIYGLI